MAKRVYVTPERVYESLRELADEYGVTVGAVSKAVGEKCEFRGMPVRCVLRVYVCTLKKGGCVVGVLDSSNRRIVPMDQGAKVSLKDVVEMRDVTIGWYFGKVVKSDAR